MNSADKRSINMEHDNIEKVQSFVLFRSKIYSTSDCIIVQEEVKRRLTLRRLAMSSRVRFFRFKSIKIPANARLVRA